MPKRLRPPPLALAVVALAVALAIAATLLGSRGHGASTSQSPSFSAGPESGFDGAALPAGTIAPAFTLTDQSGRPITLGDYRGQVVVITFLYSTCGATCVVIAQQIRGALDELRHPVRVLIVSADPAADTRARVGRFLAAASLTGRVEYLTGPVSRLRSVWRAYHVTPASSGAAAFDRFASVLLLDTKGRERVVFESEQLTPESLAHDIGKLDGEPTHP